jgi:predicted Zn-dependent protease
MSWENPQQPEGVNYSQDNPLKELVILLAGALVVLVVAVYALAMAAGWLARQVPFERETQWVAPFEQQFTGKPATAEETAARERLQAMANRIAQLQQMPAEMVLRVHIVDDDMVNAFASLGGHVMMTRGMLAALPHENALVAVLAHEVAHVKHRDPLVALGRGIAVMTAMGAVSGAG